MDENNDDLQTLATMRLDQADRLIRGHFRWHNIVINPEFNNIHLTILGNEEPTYACIMQCEGTYRIYKLPGTYVQYAFTEFGVSDVIGTCEGLIAIHSRTYIEISISNPLIGRIRFLPQQNIPQNYTLGFGRSNDIYYVILIDLDTRELTFYNHQINRWIDLQIEGPHFDIQEKTCDVVINGTPYWRASFDQNVAEIFYPTFGDQGFLFHSIPFPDIHLPRGDYRDNKLFQSHESLAFCDSSIDGLHLIFDVYELHEEGVWTRIHRGSYLTTPRFWLTPHLEVVGQDDNGVSHIKIEPLRREEQIGVSTPTMLNHVNTLIYI